MSRRRASAFTVAARSRTRRFGSHFNQLRKGPTLGRVRPKTEAASIKPEWPSGPDTGSRRTQPILRPLDVRDFDINEQKDSANYHHLSALWCCQSGSNARERRADCLLREIAAMTNDIAGRATDWAGSAYAYGLV